MILLLFPSRFSGNGYIWAMLLAYVAAKITEFFDRPLYEWLHGFSGHSLKHLLAAAGGFIFLAALLRRVPSNRQD